MSLFDKDEWAPRPEEPGDIGPAGLRRGYEALERIAPPWTQDRPIRQRHLAEPRRAPLPARCEFVGCPAPAKPHKHHTAPRAMFGDLAEYFPLVPLCEHHHRLWHDTVEDYYRREVSA